MKQTPHSSFNITKIIRCRHDSYTWMKSEDNWLLRVEIWNLRYDKELFTFSSFFILSGAGSLRGLIGPGAMMPGPQEIETKLCKLCQLCFLSLDLFMESEFKAIYLLHFSGWIEWVTDGQLKEIKNKIFCPINEQQYIFSYFWIREGNLSSFHERNIHNYITSEVIKGK